MKKALHNRISWPKFMKISLLQFFLILSFIGAASAMNGKAQILTERVTIKAEGQKISEVLRQLEGQTNVKFVFSPQMIKMNSEVSVDHAGQPLEVVLDQLLLPHAIDYEVTGKYILLRMKKRNVLQINPLAAIESRLMSSEGISIKGKVTDESGEGLPGVNVMIKGHQIGTTTNVEGQFNITIPRYGVTLVFSYVGYVNAELQANSNVSYDVVLKTDNKVLEEVVVVGYGTQKRLSVTGAIDQISGKQLEARPIANVMQGLQGVSPGLNITYAGGQPGTVPDINIRGTTSINGGSPLIVIDGIPSSDGYDLLRLNPADVTSFTVLKDAASAAVYGARAAFGVIMITTKQGAVGRKQISYNSYFSWSRPSVLPKPITDPYIFSRMLETATDNTPWDYVNFSEEYYNWARDRSNDPTLPDTRLNPSDPTRWAYMGNNDWYDYFFNKSGFSQKHGLSFSGGAKVNDMPVGYYLSTDYTKENGLNKLTDDYWKRYGLRARINFSPLKWLKVDNNLSIYQTKRAQPLTNIVSMYNLQPTDVAKNPDGTWANTTAGRVAAALVDGGDTQETTFGFQNILSATATFLKGALTVNGDASFKREQWRYDSNNKSYNIGYGPEDIRREGGFGYVTQRNGDVKNDAYNLYANYIKAFGNHAVNIMAGYSQESYSYGTLTTQRNILISSSLPYMGLTTGETYIGSSYSSYANRSYFGRVNYTFKERYILEVAGRRDGSSRFPKSSRWGFFPSVAGGWIASSERFMEFLKPTVSNLKLRASYGDLGNQNVGYFSYLQTLPTGLSGYLIEGTKKRIITGAPSLAIDPNNYTWERVSTLNFGADLGLLNNKVSLTFDYFIRNTKGMLTDGQELPATLGTSVPSQNAADLKNKGWEISAAYRNSFLLGGKPLSVEAKLVGSDSRARITKFSNEQNLFSRYRVGAQMGEIWGLESDGFFKNAQEIAELDQRAIVPWGALAIVPGWPKYKDLDGDGKIEKGYSSVDPKDLKIIGNSTPRYRIGFNLSADWKGFDASVFLQGILKMDYVPRHYLFWGPYQQPYANVYPWHMDYYRGTSESEADRARHSKSYLAAGLADANTDAKYPVLQAWLADANEAKGLDIPQTKYLMSGAYLRVKNVTLGYNLSSPAMKRIGVQRFRVFVTGENIFEFSQIKKFVDPEAVNQWGASAYPFQRKMAVGLNLEF